MEYYVIRNKNDASLAWSYEHGWTSSEPYDIFSETEKQETCLPIDGEWWTMY